MQGLHASVTVCHALRSGRTACSFRRTPGQVVGSGTTPTIESRPSGRPLVARVVLTARPDHLTRRLFVERQAS